MEKTYWKNMIGTLSISALLVTAGCSASAQQAFNEDAVISVDVSQVQKELIASGKVYTGVVEPSEEINIVPKISGKVAELPVEVGMKVKKGQVLLKLDDEDLQNTVKKAQAAASAAKANIETAKMGQQSGVVQSEGGAVQAKSGMVQADDNLTKAKNAVKLAENAVKDTNLVLKKTAQALKDAQTNHNRMKQLYADSLISKADLEKSESALVAAQSSNESAKIANKNALTGLATAKKASESAAKAYQNAAQGYEKAQEQVDISHNTSAIEASQEAWEQAKVGLDIAKDMLADSVVTSPINGMIGLKKTEVGEMVSNQSPALVVVNLEKVKVLTYIPANEINTIKIGDRVQVKAVSFDYIANGTVKTISPIDEKGKGYPVEVEVKNPNLTLKSGMVTDLQFILADAKEGMLIPNSAVVKEDGKTFVFVVNGDHPKRKEVKVKEKQGSMAIVTEGITEEDQVITNNLPVLSKDVKISYE